ncbi:MAG TPA: hypothetical protein VK044_08870 [Virgibacillus sp.]|nr:hypothetical protein [Virgibacillus sp.]
MESGVSKEEMKKRRDKDQIARDRMVAEGGLTSKNYNKKSVTNQKDETNADENESESSNKS